MPTAPYDTRVTIAVAREERATLLAVAQGKDITLAELFRRAMNAYIETSGVCMPPLARRRLGRSPRRQTSAA